ncbi:MAG: HEAT repeat domain-containing protein [Verrucomicrobiota bacterium]
MYYAGRTPDPMFKGRHASEWIDDLDQKDEQARDKARAAVNELGAQALPQLLVRLQAQDSHLKSRAMEWLAKRTGRSMVRYMAEHQHRVSDLGFMLLGEKAAPAIPELMELTANSASMSRAADALQRIGKPAIPALLEGLGSPEPLTRQVACWRLGSMRVAEATPPLIVLLRDTDARVRNDAAEALGEIQYPIVPIRTAVLALLRDRDADVRATAVKVTGSFPLGEEEFAQLLARASDPQPSVRAAVPGAVWRHSERHQQIIEAFATLLRDPREDVRNQTVSHLRAMQLGKLEPPAFVFCSFELSIRDEEAARALVTPQLRTAEVRARADILLPPLIELLADRNLETVRIAVATLGDMGRDAAVSAPKLEILATRPVPPSDFTLGRIREAAARSFRQVTGRVTDPSKPVISMIPAGD